MPQRYLCLFVPFFCSHSAQACHCGSIQRLAAKDVSYGDSNQLRQHAPSCFISRVVSCCEPISRRGAFDRAALVAHADVARAPAGLAGKK